MRIINRFFLLLIGLFSGTASAQRLTSPQETWSYLDRITVPVGNNVTSIDFDSSGNFYANALPGRVFVYSPGGQPLRDWSTGMGSYGIAVDNSNNVYVVAPGNPGININCTIKKYTALGVLVATQSSNQTDCVSVGITENGTVVAGYRFRGVMISPSDLSSHQVLRLEGDPDFSFLDAYPGNLIAISGFGIYDLNGNKIRTFAHIFTRFRNGVYYSSFAAGLGAGGGAVTPGFGAIASTINEAGEVMSYASIPPGVPSFNPYSSNIGPDGLLYVAAQSGGVIRFRRTYRTSLGTLNSNEIPSVLTSVPIRVSGTSRIRFNYTLSDADTASLETRAIALRTGASGYGSIIPIRTLTSGTAANLGASQPVGIPRTLEWDVGADVSSTSSFINIRPIVMARDRPGLLEVHYMTIPQNIPISGDPALTISVSPITEDEMFTLWLWLIAGNDPAVSLSNGRVLGVGGVIYAEGSTTTNDGRIFLATRLGARPATPAEVARARLGTTQPTIESQTPRNSAGGLPQAVNEIGFDVGFPASSLWLVR